MINAKKALETTLTTREYRTKDYSRNLEVEITLKIKYATESKGERVVGVKIDQDYWEINDKTATWLTSLGYGAKIIGEYLWINW